MKVYLIFVADSPSRFARGRHGNLDGDAGSAGRTDGGMADGL